ncbi:MAG: protein kinase, partial [Nannocystaceae bacterium]|nr:protein kinase [Nannocystaceae bacterium]
MGGRYRLESPIEKGAAGEVWRGQHMSLGKRVAIKVLRAEHVADKDDWATKRMLREAQLLSEIDHPAVVDVLDFGKEQGCPYIVMELLEGRTLSAALKAGGAMPWSVAGPLLQQMIEGLSAAHRAGVIHRDLKPANIVLQRGDSRAKIIDFGIAGASKRTRITMDGEVLGTPHFMSPEQSRTMDLAESSDIYSLGCVAFAMLVGRPPYVGKIGEIVRQHIKAPVPKVSELVASDLPNQVCNAIERSMAKLPEQRFQTMEQLHQALFDRALGVIPAEATGRRRVRARQSRRGLITAIVAGAAVAGALAVTVTSLWQRATPAPLTPAVSVPRHRAVASPPPVAVEAKPAVPDPSTQGGVPPEPPLPVEVARPKVRPDPEPVANTPTPARKAKTPAAGRPGRGAKRPPKPEAGPEV